MTKLALVLAMVGCSFRTPSLADDDATPSADANPDGENVVDPCAMPVGVPIPGRALDLMPQDRLAQIAARMPCVPPGALRDTLESTATLWYDHASLTPGYQDSFGDNVQLPIGFRPNTIDPQLIDLAVPGGHAEIFQQIGLFQFPFGNPIQATDAVALVDFWRLPDGLPAVYWQRDPNDITHRVEWMFPKGTVFGELLFLNVGGVLHPFEIRTRTRDLDGWHVDVFRPFPRATDLADAIDKAGGISPALVALVGQLRTGGLDAFTVSATHFASAFPTHTSGIDRLPAMTGADADFLHALLRTTPFRSARGIAWKTTATATAWAAGAAGPGSIVPTGYNAAAISIDEDSCSTCHQDAGRPFSTWYQDIIAYGELWGGDEIFTWHPFTLSDFVDAQGNVVNFNNDNRVIRADMTAAHLVAPYDPSLYPATTYKRIIRSWTDFAY
jgi:hypothetical protein